MTIEAKEYLQVGYKPEVFERVHHYEYRKIRKTAVDANPNWDKKQYPDHHIWHVDLKQFVRECPNKYDLIHFTFEPTEYEEALLSQVLDEDGEIIVL